MKHFILIFIASFFVGIIATPVQKSKSVPVDEVELMLQKISENLEMASVATAQGEKMVAEKVEEKAQLKEAVSIAENKVDMMTKKVEVFSAKMIGAGIDTSDAPLKLSGKTYDAWLNYVEEGGKEDFEYFRLYIYN